MKMDFPDGSELARFKSEGHSPGTMFQATINKRNLGEVGRTFSTTAWSMRTSLIACASETCARDPRSNVQQGFWIPVHLLSPERPTENATINVPADSPFDAMQSLEWSPPSCPTALLAVNSCGKATIWTHPSEFVLMVKRTAQDHCNTARAINSWSCERKWRQENTAVTKWISASSPYRWEPTTAASKPSFEDRFISQQPRAAARWPNFLCICTVYTSGYVQLHWRQTGTIDKIGGSSKWLSTNKGALGAGPSGVWAADVIVNEAGVLLVAGVPIGNPSTVVVWEVTSNNMGNPTSNPQAALKFGSGPLPSVAMSNGYSPLVATLLNWQQHSDFEIKPGQTAETKVGPSLHCSAVSNLGACPRVEDSIPAGMTSTGWSSGVAAVVFDPSDRGSSIIALVVEGYYVSPNHLDEGPSLTGWKVQRWESSSQQVTVHPLLESSSLNYQSVAYPMKTTWRMTETKSLGPSNLQMPLVVKEHILGDIRVSDSRAFAKVLFSAHGGEIAVTLASGDVQILSGQNLTLLETFHLGSYYSATCPAFSPNGCCVAYVWHQGSLCSSILKVVRVRPLVAASSQGMSSSMSWERHLADRFWWSVVNAFDWWDISASIQSIAEEGIVSVSRVLAILDADFHALPSATHRQCYGPALDCLKCQVLEGVDATDVRALVVDMQARLLLEFLRKSLDAALINPATLIADPWQASSNEVLSGLGPDAMAVDAALAPIIQGHVDCILDMASHFLTRLRRYASFCRTLSQAAVNSSSNNGSSRFVGHIGAITSNAGPQGAQAAPNNGGTAQLHAFVQGAMAKIHNSTEGGGASTVTSVGTQNTTFSSNTLNTSTFPGIPCVRLVGDAYFLHKLCQLLLFCLVFRKRQQRLGAGKTTSAGQAAEDYAPPRNARMGSGNVSHGYTADEVKFLFLVLVELCKKTSALPHPLPISQVGFGNQTVKLHHVDGQYNVVPEIVESSLGPHVQNLPRPRGADAAGLLMRELELHPPAEEWNFLVMSSGVIGLDVDRKENDARSRFGRSKKRKLAEMNAACGVTTGSTCGSYTGLLGSRRDSITATWKTTTHGAWHKDHLGSRWVVMTDMGTRCGGLQGGQIAALYAEENGFGLYNPVDIRRSGVWKSCASFRARIRHVI